MKQSGVEWIGKIPEDWKVYRNKNAFICNKEIVGKNSNSTQLLSLTTGGIKCKDINNAEGKLPESFDTYQYVKKNDVVMCLFDLDMSAVFSGISQYDGMISPAYKVLSCQDRANPLFVHYWFSYIFDGRKFNHYAKNIRYTLNYDEFATLPILLPPKETQQRIATYLDKKCSKIEETIQKQQQVIEKLKAYKQSLITEAVTGKVKIVNGKACGEYESYKDSGVEWIGKIPSEWEVKKLKFSSQIMRGLFSHRPRNDPDYYDGVHPFIQTGEVARAVKYITTYSQTLNELGFSVSREFPAGTVLLTIAANVGDVAILDFNACFPDSVIGFYPKENVSKIFMFYVLKSMKEQFMRNAIISTQMNLNINIVKEEFIPLPSLAEQKEIVKFLEKKSDYIDTAIEQKQKLIEKLTEYKKSLIYECVTGKKEI